MSGPHAESGHEPEPVDRAARLTVKYQEVGLDKVMDYYVKGFEGNITDAVWFVDVAKQQVIFKLYVEEYGLPGPAVTGRIEKAS
jgi:hypothetical protein